MKHNIHVCNTINWRTNVGYLISGDKSGPTNIFLSINFYTFLLAFTNEMPRIGHKSCIHIAALEINIIKFRLL